MSGPLRRDDRGVSEVLGYTLLVGIVAVMVIGLFAGALAVQSGIQKQIRSEQSDRSAREASRAIASLSPSNERTTLRFPERGVENLRIVRKGNVTITVNNNATCRVSLNLSSIRYENAEGRTVVHQAGGLLKKTDDSVWIESPPALGYRNGTVDLTVVNFSGSISGSTAVAELDGSNVSATSERIDRTLFQESCSAPTNVTIEITTDLYSAWSRYANEEFPDTAAVDTWSSNETVRIVLDQEELPEQANMSENDVVNLSDSDIVDIDKSVPSITVDKAADDNSYYVTAVPLNSGMQIGRIDDVTNDTTNITREPLDVVFVLDDSGSMRAGQGYSFEECDDEADKCQPDKMKQAKWAAQNFTKELTSIDRAGVIGYDNDAEYYLTEDGQYLSSNYNKTKDSIDQLEDDGGTRINRGLRKANALLDLKSNESQDKFIVLLTDGRNNDDNRDHLNDKTIKKARIAASNNVTIYTVGFGDREKVAESLLKKIANITGGEYYFADDKEKLDSVFDEIAEKITDSNQIVRPPVSLTIEAGGDEYVPQIEGDTDYIANYSDGDLNHLNVNDPLAPPFSFALAAGEEEPISIKALKYECAKWQNTGTTVKNESTGTVYNVVRCAEINQSAEPTVINDTDATLYFDGENASKVIQSADDIWWAKNMSKALDPYTNDTDGDLEFDLASNQAIVVFDFGKNGRMIVLYEVGKSKQGVDLDYIVDVTVRNVTVSDDGEASLAPPSPSIAASKTPATGDYWRPPAASTRS